MNRNRGFQFLLIGLILPAPIVLAQSDMSGSESWALQPYQGNRDQFTLDIPEAWHVVDQSPYSADGVIAFYSQPLVMRIDKDAPDKDEQQEKFMVLMNDMISGAVPSFFIDRYKMGKGLSCAGYSEQAQKKKLKLLTSAAALGKGAKVVGKPEVSNVEFAGCQGLKILVRSNMPDGQSQEMLVYSTGVDDLTYDFVLLNHAAYMAQNRPWFERVMATVRMTGVQ